MNKDPCLDCGWYDCDMGCSCPSLEKWYQCPLEPEPTEEDFKTVDDRISEIIRDIATKSDNFILELFAKYGYSREDVFSLAKEDRITCTEMTGGNRKIYDVDCVPLFCIESTLVSDSENGEVTFCLKEVDLSETD